MTPGPSAATMGGEAPLCAGCEQARRSARLRVPLCAASGQGEEKVGGLPQGQKRAPHAAYAFPCCGGQWHHTGVTHLTDPDRALWEVARIAYSDVRELFDEHGHLRPVHALPEQLAAAIASITIVRRDTHIIQKVRFWDKPKALGMLLTHFGLLTEDVDLSGDAELVARLEAGRKRAAGKR